MTKLTHRLTMAVFAVAALNAASILCAQNGRFLVQSNSTLLGQTASFQMHYPPSIAGNFALLAVSLQSFPGAVPGQVAGYNVVGLMRIDLPSAVVLGWTLLDSTGRSQPWSLAIPNNPIFTGYQLDLQGFDYNAQGNTITCSDNDVTATVDVSVTLDTSLNMVAIPSGTFSMGSPVTPLDVPPYFNQADAQPVHQVTLTRPFWMARHEVTQSLYQAVMGNNPSWFQRPAYPNLPTRPVEQVSWNDARAFCTALTAREAAAGRLPAGYVYRLPTEAEWEYCCRAGTTSEFSTGAELLCGQANLASSLHPLITGETFCNGPGFPQGVSTLAVGTYQANPFGLYDMQGNVYEWCLDSWDLSANYPAAAVANPFVGTGTYRIVRGGSWRSSSPYCRSARRSEDLPNLSNFDVGFRVVLAPPIGP